jgi:hypothetical protein
MPRSLVPQIDPYIPVPPSSSLYKNPRSKLQTTASYTSSEKKPSPQSCGSRKHIHLGFNLGTDCKPRVILENQKLPIKHTSAASKRRKFQLQSTRRVHPIGVFKL